MSRPFEFPVGSISEFGVSPRSYAALLSHLEAAVPVTAPDRSRSLLVATFGSADLVEISFFPTQQDLSTLRGGSGRVFRRSSGVYAPHRPEGEAPASGYVEVVSPLQLLDVDDSRPFFGVIYAKLSPILGFCVSPEEDELRRRPTALDVYETLSSPESGIWREFRAHMERNPAPSPRARPGVRVAPLVGLDAVDAVILVRASTLEEMAGVAWAARESRASSTWTKARAKQERLGRLSLHGQPDFDRAQWDRIPLFEGTSTLVGIPLRRSATTSRWSPEGARQDCERAAASSWLSARYDYEPGALRSVLQMLSLDRPTASGDGPASTVPVAMLFDHVDLLSPLRDPEAASKTDGGPGPVSIGFLRRRLEQLIQVGASGAEHGEVRVRTEIALAAVVPSDSQEPPRPIRNLRHLIERRREHHLSSPDGWVARWRAATTRHEVPSPIVHGGLNLIDAVLEYVSEDPDEFIDVLPLLERLVTTAETLHEVQAGRELTLRDLAWLYDTATQWASLRGRRDHPLRLPRGTLAFEAHAGYRTGRVAFQGYAAEVARLLGYHGEVVLMDGAGARISCDVTLANTARIYVSTLALHHPLYWAPVAHELAHGRLLHETAADMLSSKARAAPFGFSHVTAGLGLPPASPERAELEPEADEDTRALHAASALGPLETLLRLMEQRVRALRTTEFSLLTSCLRPLIGEVPADLAMADALGGRHSARFWMAYGPSLAYEHLLGRVARAPHAVADLALLVRVFFVDMVLRSPPAHVDGSFTTARAWARDLQDFLTVYEFRLRAKVNPGRPDFVAESRWEPLVRIAEALREDLRLPPASWRVQVNQLWNELGQLLDADPLEEGAIPSSDRALLEDGLPSGSTGNSPWHKRQLLEVVAGWLHLSGLLRTSFQSHPLPGPASSRYGGYLDELIARLAPKRPWPPFRAPSDGESSAVPGRLHLDPRGGVTSWDLAAGNSARSSYEHLTLDLVLRLRDFARLNQFESLVRFLEGRSPPEAGHHNEGQASA